MKQVYQILALTGALLLSGCKSDDSNFEELLAQAKEAPIEITFTDDTYPELPDVVPPSSDESYNDYVESFSEKVTVTLEYTQSGVTITKSSSKVTVIANESHVTANISTTPVKFILKGESSNGSLRVFGDNRYCISLAGVTLCNPEGPAINNQSKKTLYVVSEPGTTNRLSSQGDALDASDAKGCLFSEGQIAFSGSGFLNVTSAFRNGIASDDYIFIRPGCQLYVNCLTGNGIKANDGVIINGGTIDILVSYNGGKGINSEQNISINGGRTTIINEGITRLDEVPVSEEFKDGIDTVSCAGVKCDTDLAVTAGELRIKCTGNDSKGIKTNANYSQNGGTVKIVTLGQKILSSPKGIKADGDIIVDNGYLYSYSKCSSALDALGAIKVYSYIKQKAYLVEIGKI